MSLTGTQKYSRQYAVIANYDMGRPNTRARSMKIQFNFPIVVHSNKLTDRYM